MSNIYKDEYSVEARNETTGAFIEQIAVVPTYKQAEEIVDEILSEKAENEGIIYNIYCIEYDNKGDEKAYYLVI